MITYLIIAVTVICSFLAWNNPDTIGKLTMNPYYVFKRKEYYRLLTSGFIHQDMGHLFFNMLSLYFFGLGLEQWFKVRIPMGGTVYVLFYIAAIVISDLPTLFKHKNSGSYNSLGASGGISAVLFAYIVLNPTDKIYLYAILGLPAFLWGALYMFYTAYQARNTPGGGINHDAHLYGALFGIVFTLIAFQGSAIDFVTQLMNWRLF